MEVGKKRLNTVGKQESGAAMKLKDKLKTSELCKSGEDASIPSTECMYPFAQVLKWHF